MNDRARHLVTAGVWMLSLAVLAVPAGASAADAPQVSQIRVEGNKQMSVPAVLVHVRTRVGAAFDESVISADQKRLLETGRFQSVQVTRSDTEEGIVVTFVVVERPLVAKVVFEGNQAYKDKELSALLTFRASDALNLYAVEAARQAILDKYQSTGFGSATVEVDGEALEARQEVIYRIVEGPRSAVARIRFEGNKHFGGWRLRQLIGTAARIWPLRAGYLDVGQVDRDVQAVRDFYFQEGFLEVQVSRQLDLTRDPKRATVVFVINEGGRFRVNRVIFEGNTVFSSEQLADRLKLRQGEFFTSLDLRRDTQQIHDSYGEVGYIEVQVTPAKQFLDPTAPPPEWASGLDGGEPSLLNVVFKIVEAGQYHIGRIDIRGNRITQGRVIRRELRFLPEQPYNTAAVDESQRRLMETGLFEKVNITPVGQAPKTRDVLVEVAEIAKTARFVIGAGINSNTGLLGTVSLTQQNFDILRWPRDWADFTGGRAFKGAGQTFRIVAEPGVELMRFHVDWFEPCLFDQPYSLGAKTFLFTTGRESYDETRYGEVVSVGHRFKNRWYGELSPSLEGVEISDLDRDAPPEVVKDAGTHALAGIKGTLVRDRTDSRWMPSTGDRLSLSLQQTIGGFNFQRAMGDYHIYRTVYVDALDRKHVLAGRLAVGQVFGDAPFFERFYGGGIGSVRGFDYRGISPRSKGTDKPIGGDFMLFAGTEYRFPLVGKELSGAVFLDTGTVEDSTQITSYRAAAGVGLRWVIPLLGPVPMSLDLAFPLSKAEQDDTQVLSFTVGWTL